jgi:geranylgeranyl pyrophosphate synthase
MHSGDYKKESLKLIGELQERSTKCHEFVRASFLSEIIEQPRLREALEHYFSYWADFTHPGLFSIACEAVGKEPDELQQVQAALAMMGAAFDIHDDIVDRSPAKHGYPTVFGKYGGDVALLLGNAFMVNGFALMGNSISDFPSKSIREVFRTLKNCLFEVGNAHALELDLKGRVDVSPRKWMQIVRMKAASIEADMHIAALLCAENRDEIRTLKEYGRILGTLTILREEFIDIFETEELIQRIRNGTPPIPLLFARQDKRLNESINKILQKKALKPADIDKLVGIINRAARVKILKRSMEKSMDIGISLTTHVRSRKAKRLLADLVSSMLQDL